MINEIKTYVRIAGSVPPTCTSTQTDVWKTKKCKFPNIKALILYFNKIFIHVFKQWKGAYTYIHQPNAKHDRWDNTGISVICSASFKVETVEKENIETLL